MSIEKKLEKALLATGAVQSVWHCAGTELEATALCRAAGDTKEAKEEVMEILARIVTPFGVFVARQFIVKEDRFGYCWNISIFDPAHLDALSEVRILPPTKQAPPAPRKQPAADDGWRVGVNEEGDEFFYKHFPLPHASENRNAPTSGKRDGDVLQAPLGHGRGATRTIGKKRR